MIEIKDVIHLYLGCDVRHQNGVIIKMNSVALNRMLTNKYEMDAYKLLLRPLSSMTEEEKEEIPGYYCPKGFAWLLSHHFDLFNLHEQGMCLYKSDLK